MLVSSDVSPQTLLPDRLQDSTLHPRRRASQGGRFNLQLVTGRKTDSGL